MFKQKKCPRCSRRLHNLSCQFCAEFFGLQNCYIFGFYTQWKPVIIKNKRGLNRTESPFLSYLLRHCYDKLDKELFFVPPQNGVHWLTNNLEPDHKNMVCSALQKRKDNLSQKLLNREERLLNSVNLFQFCDDCRINAQGIIIDDVVSTGASLKACTRLLKKHGYTSLDALVLCVNESEKKE
jgi:hypothetical protein